MINQNIIKNGYISVVRLRNGKLFITHRVMFLKFSENRIQINKKKHLKQITLCVKNL